MSLPLPILVNEPKYGYVLIGIYLVQVANRQWLSAAVLVQRFVAG